MGWTRNGMEFFTMRIGRATCSNYFVFLRRAGVGVATVARLGRGAAVAALALPAGFAAAGSPVAAFVTSPPPSSAICASRRLLTMERGFSALMSSVDAY